MEGGLSDTQECILKSGDVSRAGALYFDLGI
jgi:hypothetical protein